MSWLKLDVMLAFFFKRERERELGVECLFTCKHLNLLQR